MVLATIPLPALANTLTPLAQLPGGGDGLAPWGGLVNISGTFYGTTLDGGAYGRGAVFSINPSTGAEKLLYSFQSGADATDPQAGLLNVSGTLYGVSNTGGANGYGAVYSINPSIGAETVLFSLTPQMGGGSGSNLVYANGTLYGTTFGGGTGAGYGAIFSVDIASGAGTLLYAFTGAADGASPQTGIAYAAGVLYGTTTGGAKGAGTLFSLNLKSGKEATLYTFDGGANGGGPYGGVTAVAGILYGTTAYGGNGKGTVFSYTLKTKAIHTVYNFTGGADGSGPQCTLLDVGGILYGESANGGAGYGAVFAVNATTGAETTLHTFAGGADGGYSLTPLIDVNKTLYGATTGALNVGDDGGTVFKVALSTAAFKNLHNFAVGVGEPANSSLVDVAGTFYGTAGGSSGSNLFGAIYAFDPSTNTRTTLYSFTGAADGGAPSGGLLAIGSLLYGVAQLGGANGVGVIFSFNPASNTEIPIFSFPAGASLPNDPLLTSKNILYGTTKFGGANGAGTVFTYTKTTNSYTTLYSFGTNTNDGTDPAAGLTLSGGLLYGTTEFGGADGGGTLFSVNLTSGAESVLHSFSSFGTDGSLPVSRPTLLDGTLYGTTLYGGITSCFGGSGCGVLYGYTIATGNFAVLHSFNYAGDGAYLGFSPTAIGTTLYGSTGVASGLTAGTLFTYKPATAVFDTIYQFTGNDDGGFGESGLLDAGGLLYGVTYGGGATDTGVIFSLTTD